MVVLGTCFLVACASTSGPRIELSRDKIADRGRLELKGTGFTPKASIISHMKRPDETEFPVLRFLTDDKGEFTHSIDTLTLLAGTHEVWVVDEDGVSSNVVKFEVLN
jgi:hypothetical protein